MRPNRRRNQLHSNQRYSSRRQNQQRSVLPNKELFYLHWIRVITILGIVLYHSTILLDHYAGIPTPFFYLKSLYAGVDFLFVLSGFLMYYLYRYLFGHQSAIGSFLLRRAIRIYPLYLVLTLCLVPAYFVFPHLGVGTERDPLMIVQSLLLWPGVYPILSVGWTLSYQLYFYGLFSLLFSKQLTYVFFLVMGLSVIGLFIHLPAFWFSYYNLEFLIGVLAAYCLLHLRRVPSVYLVGVGMIALIASMLIDTLFERVLMDEKRVVAYGVPAFFLTWGLAQAKHIVSQADGSIRFLSEASFAIFLSHYPILALFSLVLYSFMPSLVVVWWLLSVVLALATGMVIYLKVEKPLTLLIMKRLVVNPTRSSYR